MKSRPVTKEIAAPDPPRLSVPPEFAHAPLSQLQVRRRFLAKLDDYLRGPRHLPVIGDLHGVTEDEIKSLSEFGETALASIKAAILLGPKDWVEDDWPTEEEVEQRKMEVREKWRAGFMLVRGVWKERREEGVEEAEEAEEAEEEAEEAEANQVQEGDDDDQQD